LRLETQSLKYPTAEFRHPLNKYDKFGTIELYLTTVIIIVLIEYEEK